MIFLVFAPFPLNMIQILLDFSLQNMFYLVRLIFFYMKSLTFSIPPLSVHRV